jgi:hypothetical protein
MPGAYAHLTVVNLVKEPARLENQGFMPEAIVSVLDYFRFCELGAVSRIILISISFIPMLVTGQIECIIKELGI